jgi:hypothetical protein
MAHHNRRRKWINQQREIACALMPFTTQPQPVGGNAFSVLHQYFQHSMPYDNRANVVKLLDGLRMATPKP